MDLKTGKKFLKEKNYFEAEKIFLNLLKNDINSFLCHFFLGGIYFELNNYQKSKLHYKNALKINKNSKEILVNFDFSRTILRKINFCEKNL